eukprot:TRINITY_DN10328_c0_g1_i1.p1 TRINITY_DN10328_c0_g1~~TRINITY_DN10328_c0_g1_i1.p1  ORF type:complete len:331 (+),score=29.74 TRINITY_DN10328_c0_g1_i1:176-1168(+)
MPKCVILGGGVVGLTTALHLRTSLPKSIQIELVARDFGANTTSHWAGAYWIAAVNDYLTEDKPRAIVTYEHLSKLLAVPESGVRLVPGTVYLKRSQRTTDVWFRDVVQDFQWLSQEEIPPSLAAASGFRCKTLFANMPVYLDYLRQQLDQLGVHIAQRHVNRLSDLQRSGEQICVVNCCGLSAQNLVDVHDDTLYPIRGQIELVKHDSDEFVTLREGEHPISILPRGDGTAVLNGTYDADNYDLNPDATVSKAIRERCAMLDPRVQHAPNITSHVALRPARRGGVRLEAEHTDQGMVVHNYGHGGRGLVLSYGCANEVLNTLRAAWNVLN